MSEFDSLAQAPKMSIDEYSSKFHSLRNYSPTIMAEEALKIYHFKKGLNSRIKSAIFVIEPNRFDELMGSYIRAKNDIKRCEGEYKLKCPHSSQYQQSGQQFKKPKFSSNRPPVLKQRDRLYLNQTKREPSPKLVDSLTQENAVRILELVLLLKAGSPH